MILNQLRRSAGGSATEAEAGRWHVAAESSIMAFALAVVCVMGCASRDAPRAPVGADPVQRTAAPKKLTAAIMSEAASLSERRSQQGRGAGTDELAQLVNAALVRGDDQANALAELAEAVPTLENGLWRVFPDGRMETTWRLKDGTLWHDGQPLTSDDLRFTVTLGQDRELAIQGDQAFSLIEGVATPDSRTITVRWSGPYIEADTLFSHGLFSYGLAVPLPRHLLESAYLAAKGTFFDLPHWSDEFVGAGPFRLRQFERGSHVLLEANATYVLGRPRIDEIEVRFISTATVVPTVIAGELDLTMGRDISIEQGLQIQDQWRGGRVDFSRVGGGLALYAQFVNPSPVVVADVRFRRAVLHALDRREMAEVLQAGVGRVADSYLFPSDREYRETESSLVRYEHDPRRAIQLIEELGYSRSADGRFQTAAGQRLSLEITTTPADFNRKTILSVADYWQRIGIGADVTMIPPQRARDLEYRSNFSGFSLTGARNGVRTLRNLHSSQAPLPTNNYLGNNTSRYQSPELDALIDTYGKTIPLPDRMRVLGSILHHVSDQLNWMGLTYDVDSTMIGSRLKNAGPVPWNSHLWDID
jgi:peptide/nickel transport system substrate-binding protein